MVATGRLRTRDYAGGQWRTVVESEANAIGLDLARGAAPGVPGMSRPPPGGGRGLVCLPGG
ncbi:hypothetical protein ACWDKQ_02145 [Saccharopolyspora sp. NPDC000995]